MSATIVDATGGILTLQVTGRLTEREVIAAQKSVAAAIRQQGRVCILVRAEAFEGWERGGEWNDFSFQEQYDPFIEKMAIVGDQKWKEQALLFTAKGLRPFPIEYFMPDELEKARAWLSWKP